MLQLTNKTRSCSTLRMRPWWTQTFRDCVVALVAIFLATMIGLLLSNYMDEENVIGIYLLAIVLISLTCSRAVSLLSCGISVFCFDFFIMPPRLVVCPPEPALLLSFGVMFIVAAAISHLTSQTKNFTDQLEQHVRLRTEELQKANDNLRLEVDHRMRAEESNESLIKELTASNAVLMRLVRIASHDLQEPLRVIQGYCDLLKRRYAKQLTGDGSEFLDFIVEGTHRMESLIQGVLSHARVKQGIERFQKTELDGVVEEALSNIAVSIEQSGATIVQDELPVVTGDRTQLVQLFQNLILNAVRFRGEKPLTVQISGRQDGNSWLLSVVDNGIGIDPAYHDEIFGMFRRLSSQMVPSGSGIGLAICKSVVENHGGRIRVESEAGVGSKFIFSLPA